MSVSQSTFWSPHYSERIDRCRSGCLKRIQLVHCWVTADSFHSTVPKTWDQLHSVHDSRMHLVKTPGSELHWTLRSVGIKVGIYCSLPLYNYRPLDKRICQLSVASRSAFLKPSSGLILHEGISSFLDFLRGFAICHILQQWGCEKKQGFFHLVLYLATIFIVSSCPCNVRSNEYMYHIHFSSSPCSPSLYSP